MFNIETGTFFLIISRWQETKEHKLSILEGCNSKFNK